MKLHKHKTKCQKSTKNSYHYPQPPPHCSSSSRSSEYPPEYSPEPSETAGKKPISVSQAVLRAMCNSTPDPDLCFSVVSSASSGGYKLTSQKDVIAAILNAAVAAARRSYVDVESVIMARSDIPAKTEVAVNVCLETIELGLEDLRDAAEAFRLYPTKENLQRQAHDLNILISSAMTYQETCLDGFSGDPFDKLVREIFSDSLIKVERLSSIILHMIKSMTETDIANFEPKSRTSTTPDLIKEVTETAAEVVGDGWPWWLSEKDRRFLESSEIKPDAVVAADGSGDFTMVAEAVEAAPNNSKVRYVIKIKAGVYREIVRVPSKKKMLMLVGDGRLNTIITGNLSVGGTPNMSTFNSATVVVTGDHFLARDITFENTAGPANAQAVAIRLGADHSAFYRCGFSAYQDTLYVHSKRQFFRNCFVAGTVDFIFGNSAVVLQNCDIDARIPGRGKQNMVTAQGRTDKNQDTGIVIQNCRINATSDLWPVMDEYPSYLGRPWQEYSRTVVMQSSISEVINPKGWRPWNSSNFYLDTLTYREYSNRGPGANTKYRVKWKGFKVITDPKEAEPYTADEFIDGSSWVPETGFPYQPGL
ncbi:PREDICTED: pectinesterase-like [Tarenaya hassleriana]|uniref:pectinesterase-like n=1 Tax=Tarenaya hassleriana TaxID=28532 RepID=UPI00053C9690|nr:PREDICTED: pectinesterase-like [Tarenaya hassleriana]